MKRRYGRCWVDLESGREDTLSAGQILSLHADHRRGMHTVAVDGCTQCLFERLDKDDLEAASAGALDLSPD